MFILRLRIFYICRVLPVGLACFLLPSSVFASARVIAAKTSAVKASTQVNVDYAFALAGADQFLHAWQAGDAENGIALLTSHAKEKITPDILEDFFSSAAPTAFEIERGKMLRGGRYEFPVVLIRTAAKGGRARRRLSSIVILNTGHNDWAVDKLP